MIPLLLLLLMLLYYYYYHYYYHHHYHYYYYYHYYYHTITITITITTTTTIPLPLLLLLLLLLPLLLPYHYQYYYYYHYYYHTITITITITITTTTTIPLPLLLLLLLPLLLPYHYHYYYHYYYYYHYHYYYYLSNLWTSINRDNERRRREFLGGVWGRTSPENFEIGSLKTPFSALWGRNMWQNGTENWWHLSQNSSKYPIQAIFWSMTSLQLRCFSKSGHFASRLRSSRDSGFSVKIGTVPPKSGRLDG